MFVTGNIAATFQANTPVSQGNAGSVAESWYMRITDGTQVLGTGSSAPLWVSGTVDLLNPVTVVFSGGLADVHVTNTASITGSVTVNSILAPISGAVNIAGVDLDAGALTVTGAVDILNPVTTKPLAGTTTVVTGYGASTANVTVLAANTARHAATFFMEGKATAYIKLGATATSTDYTVKLLNNAYYEMPDQYTGQIDVVFDKTDAAQVLHITEIND